MCTIIDKRIKPGKYIYKMVDLKYYEGKPRIYSAFQDSYVWKKGINEAKGSYVTTPPEEWKHGNVVFDGAFHGFATLFLLLMFIRASKGSWLENKQIIRVKTVGDTFIGEADNFDYEYDGCPQIVSTKVEWDGTVRSKTTGKWLTV